MHALRKPLPVLPAVGRPVDPYSADNHMTAFKRIDGDLKIIPCLTICEISFRDGLGGIPGLPAVLRAIYIRTASAQRAYGINNIRIGCTDGKLRPGPVC